MQANIFSNHSQSESVFRKELSIFKRIFCFVFTVCLSLETWLRLNYRDFLHFLFHIYILWQNFKQNRREYLIYLIFCKRQIIVVEKELLHDSYYLFIISAFDQIFAQIIQGQSSLLFLNHIVAETNHCFFGKVITHHQFNKLFAILAISFKFNTFAYGK